jgi:glycosyltransferase involved in cell wall biosynthesis
MQAGWQDARIPDDLFVLIPAYNEAPTIRDVVERTLRHAGHVIVIDDGSTDGSGDLIRDLPVRLVRQERNGGKASALMAGFQIALSEGAAGVITLDADGQHRPEEIPLFVAAFRSRPDAIVVGSRLWNRAAVPAVRYWANRFASFWMSRASGAPLDDCQSGFRLYPAAALVDVKARYGPRNGFTFESEFLIDAVRSGFAVVFVRISVTYPKDHMQQTHYNHVFDNLAMVRMVSRKIFGRRPR